MRSYPNLGIQIPQILLPKAGTDYQKWAVIACDQFTSEPEYWQSVEKTVGSSPSTFNMILPEVYLGKPEEAARLQSTQETMKEYQEKGILEPYEGLVLVERTVDGKTRRGVMMALDLEQYNFNKGSQSLIRATEGTVLDRLPPRMRIREGASLELPHILVLVDDPERTVIEPLFEQASQMKPLYDFELMLGSGHLRGYFSDQQKLEAQMVRALGNLSDSKEFCKKYGVNQEKGILLFAVGDGNHSLATAKSIWEKIKGQVGMDHPARYALVELENVHDQGLEFEPIHRVLFNVKGDYQAAMKKHFGDNFAFIPCKDAAEMAKKVKEQKGPEHLIGAVSAEGAGIISISHSASNLPVGTLQPFLDEWLKQGNFEKIDYVHGEDVTIRLGNEAGNLGLLLPAMDKSDLFKTVILDGVLPRKTFSMGEAKEKRFYVESRRIV